MNCHHCNKEFKNQLVSYILAGGALQKSPQNPAHLSIADDCLAFLNLDVHSHDPSVKESFFELVAKEEGGQFELNFCSKTCLKNFFCEAVDEL
jgi:hypothetical protein